jgi:hypothetical protein
VERKDRGALKGFFGWLPSQPARYLTLPDARGIMLVKAETTQVMQSI